MTGKLRYHPGHSSNIIVIDLQTSFKMVHVLIDVRKSPFWSTDWGNALHNLPDKQNTGYCQTDKLYGLWSSQQMHKLDQWTRWGHPTIHPVPIGIRFPNMGIADWYLNVLDHDQLHVHFHNAKEDSHANEFGEIKTDYWTPNEWENPARPYQLRTNQWDSIDHEQNCIKSLWLC